MTTSSSSQQADSDVAPDSLILVSGMHRSGTSAVAGSLQVLGCDLGDRLLEAQPDNPVGFFELQPVMDAHDEILRWLGATWDDPRSLDPLLLSRDQQQAARRLLVSAVRTELGSGGVAVVKDPRAARLTSVWREVFEELELEARYLHVFRQPGAVARSLFARSGATEALAVRLWEVHNFEFESATRGATRSLLDFDEFVVDPVDALERVGEQLNLSWPKSARSRRIELVDFVRPSLIHNGDDKIDHPLLKELRRLQTKETAASLSRIDSLKKSSESADFAALDFASHANNRAVVRLERTGEKVRGIDARVSGIEQAITNLGNLHPQVEQLQAQTNNLPTLDTRISGIEQVLTGWAEIFERLQWLSEVDAELGERVSAIEAASTGSEIEVLRNRVDSLQALAEDINHRTLQVVPVDEHVVEVAHELVAPANPLVADQPNRKPRFAPADQPVVSIIVPVFNQVDVTLRCLRAVARFGPEVPYEVIVGNDCSTDPDFEKLREVKGLRIADMSDNGGFGANCNNAASQARGEYLFFLNNDTMVQPRSIDLLLETFTMFPNTGIAGSKLLYPDGRVQDAGGIIWRDGSAWNYGHSSFHDTPAHGYSRVTDYVAGAALLIRKSLFDELGGFDSLYAPAYYEDTDLCMKVNQMGLEVRLQPESLVMHDEGTSYGTDLAQEGKHNQVINARKFFDRWEDELRGHRENGDQPEFEKERRVKKRILLIDARMLTPDADSGSLRMTNLCRAFTADGHKVTFVPKNLQAHPPYDSQLKKAGIEVIALPHTRNIETFLAERGAEFDVVVLSRIEVADQFLDAARKYCPDAKIIFDTVDLHFVREMRELEVTGASSLPQSHSQTREAELDAMRKSDTTWVVSTTEVDLIKSEVPGVDVQLVSNVHDEARSPHGIKGRTGLLFVGGFEHTPNIDGITWFCQEVLPLVWQKKSSIRLHIVGSNPPAEILSLESNRVWVHGFVPDLSPFYDTTRLAVAPLRYGAGVKGKVTQALARGLPVVGTPMATEGMPGTPGEDYLVASTPEEFAEEILAAYFDGRRLRKLANNGRELYERSFSSASVAGLFDKPL